MNYTADYHPVKEARVRKPSAAGAERAEAWRIETKTSGRTFGEFLRDGPLPESTDCNDCDGTGEGQYDGQNCSSCRGSGTIRPARLVFGADCTP